MTQIKHTPGKWEAKADGRCWLITKSQSELIIAGALPREHRPIAGVDDGTCKGQYKPEEECKANATLIAAAPALLDVAKEAAAEPCSTIGLEDLEPGCCKSCRARATVAAATGRPA